MYFCHREVGKPSQVEKKPPAIEKPKIDGKQSQFFIAF